MERIAAGAVVAPMARLHSFFDRPAQEELERDAVGESASRELSIASGRLAGLPFPAFVASADVDLAPEVPSKRFGSLRSFVNIGVGVGSVDREHFRSCASLVNPRPAQCNT